MIDNDQRIRCGAQLKKIREARGLTQKQAAKQMKIGVSTLSEYENDKYDDPPMYTLRKIFKFYGLNFSKYFDEGIIAFDTRNYSDIGIKKATINHIAESKKKFDLFNENEENNDNKL